MRGRLSCVLSLLLSLSASQVLADDSCQWKGDPVPQNTGLTASSLLQRTVRKTPTAHKAETNQSSIVLPALYTTELPEDYEGEVAENAVTVVLMGYMDKEGLLGSACYHAAMAPLVARVVVVWNGLSALAASEAPCAGQPSADSLLIKVMPYNTLLNRYIVYPDVHTKAVLLLDDDISVNGAFGLIYLFNQWLQHPLNVYGMQGHCLAKVEGVYVYDNPARCTGTVHITTGTANMVDRDYLRQYFDQPTVILEHIYNNRPTCEDIALNFMVSHRTKLRSMSWGKKSNKPTKTNNRAGPAISDSLDFEMKRSACVEKFVAAYGYCPVDLENNITSYTSAEWATFQEADSGAGTMAWWLKTEPQTAS